ncbi:hypothetical protein AB0K12_31910 [Nonomuraea sp. NPDC049419]
MEEKALAIWAPGEESGRARFGLTVGPDGQRFRLDSPELVIG